LASGVDGLTEYTRCFWNTCFSANFPDSAALQVKNPGALALLRRGRAPEAKRRRVRDDMLRANALAERI